MRSKIDQQQLSHRSMQRADRVRRGFDVIVSALLLIATAPIVLTIAVVSAIWFRAWPIFCQERVGKDGRSFCCWKVRTLPTAVPSFTDKHDLANYEIPIFWHVVRRHHLDELPQLALVFVGRMSMVGPRPEMQYLHDSMDPDFAALRTSVRPGCTGLWQVSKGSAGLITSSPEYDRCYVENRSLRLDLWIALQTVTAMLGVAPRLYIEDVPSWARRSADSDHPAIIDLRDLRDLRDLAPERLSIDAEAAR